MLMKTRSTAEPVPTFAEAGVALNELRRRHIKREPEDKRLLEIHVHPQLGALSVTDIEQAHVVEVLYAVRGRAPKSVRRVRQCIARVLAWAIAHGLRADNPCSPDLDRLVEGCVARTEPHAALPYSQVPDAVAGIRSATHWIGATLLFEFLVLTAARPGDARLARWGEIDVERASWRVPFERARIRGGHVVPLSQAALAVVGKARAHPELQEARGGGGGSGIVFPSKRGRVVSSGALRWMLSRLGIEAAPYGFRQSFAEWAVDTGVDRTVVQACLWPAQVDRNSCTLLRSQRLPVRVPVMEEWGRHVVPPAGLPPAALPSLPRGAPLAVD